MSRRLTNKEFIERVRKIHGDKYDYSKIDYKNSETKVCVICPKHGEYWTFPFVLLNGGECNKCAYEKKAARKTKTTEEFIRQAKLVHGDKYDYSKANYINAKTKVCIVCPKHGEFWQEPCYHLRGEGCNECAKEIRKNSSRAKKTRDEFIKECIELYGDAYDYSKVVYINAHTNVCVIDKSDNSEILISPTQFLTHGTPKKRRVDNINKFIAKAKEIHGDKYDYSKVEYINCKTKVCIICPEHGEFWQTPSNHFKYGCYRCGIESGVIKTKKTTNEFIEKAKKVHGNKYDYSKVEYVNNKSKVCIICPEHGEFWQTPIKHLSGQGCPICKNSWLERDVLLGLEKNKINYIFQYSPDFLKNGRGKQKIDYFLPDYKVAIECQGIQHFIPTSIQPMAQVQKNKERDIRKKRLCEENNIKMIYYIPQDNMKYIGECEIYNDTNSFDNIDKIIKTITEK